MTAIESQKTIAYLLLRVGPRDKSRKGEEQTTLKDSIVVEWLTSSKSTSRSIQQDEYTICGRQTGRARAQSDSAGGAKAVAGRCPGSH
jgi:hypothetical protein